MTESTTNAPAKTEDATTTAMTPLKQSASLVAQYAKAITNDKRAQQFAATVSMIARKDPKIAECHPDSLVAAMMACVHLDIMPNTPEQLAYIIPYNNRRLNRMEAQFQVGYKGMIELAYRTGQIKSIHAELVFKEDEFDIELGSERVLKHKPDFGIDRTDLTKATHIYATAKLTNGETTFEVMSRSELSKVRETVKANTSDGPWATWGEMMAKKTVIKRLLKTLPQSATDNRLSYAAQYDSLAEVGKLRVNQQGEIIEGKIIVAEKTDEEKQAIKDEAGNKAAELLNENEGDQSDGSQSV